MLLGRNRIWKLAPVSETDLALETALDLETGQGPEFGSHVGFGNWRYCLDSETRLDLETGLRVSESIPEAQFPNPWPGPLVSESGINRKSPNAAPNGRVRM